MPAKWRSGVKKNHICISLMAHVDAGKTTLSESILYTAGTIRKQGRVDNKDTYLDTNEMEKARGITIFSKQAVFKTSVREYTLLDTPGHVDFSSEMERTLSVIDYAVLIISGLDGVQSHTKTLWRLLEQMSIPVFIFVNKMDQTGIEKEYLLSDIKKKLSGNVVEFGESHIKENEDGFFEELAMASDDCMDKYLASGKLDTPLISSAIKKRHVFPCLFGSALKNTGVEELIRVLDRYIIENEYKEDFAARVYKITRDEQGNRLTHIKVTGGMLKVRQLIGEEKISQIRIYSGVKYESVSEVEAGYVCTLLGLENTYPGQGLGSEQGVVREQLEPVLNYRIVIPDSITPTQMLINLRILEEEEPKLGATWDEKLQEIHVNLMGEVQTEILKGIIKERFGLDVEFDEGNVVYKETILNTVEGVGHFEPLRHYAEVHLLLEAAERGSGIIATADCSEDILDKNWQRLILTHINEKRHKGVLIGAELTDVKITLVTGRAHMKHTEGGDFRQATYRAVRQGLMQAESVLLEPYYSFVLDIPSNMIGRAMTDIERMHGTSNPVEIDGNRASLSGRGPVVSFRNYQKEVSAYCAGEGSIVLTPAGYDVCHNAEEVISRKAYNPELDNANPVGSVFCAHGGGFAVEWQNVFHYMHVEKVWDDNKKELVRPEKELKVIEHRSVEALDLALGTEEIDAILAKNSFANSHNKGDVKRWTAKKHYIDELTSVKTAGEKSSNTGKEKYLLVDGYNVIFAWDEFSLLAKDNLDGARGKLLDILCNYQGAKDINVIAVFDAYRLKGHNVEYLDYHNIHVVYTKEAETADRYIERFAHENGRKYDITVVTSDGLEQVIILGEGCQLISAREFERKVNDTIQKLLENYALKTRMELR